MVTFIVIISPMVETKNCLCDYKSTTYKKKNKPEIQVLLSIAPFKTFWSEIYRAKAAPNPHRVGGEGLAARAPREHQAVQ